MSKIIKNKIEIKVIDRTFIGTQDFQTLFNYEVECEIERILKNRLAKTSDMMYNDNQVDIVALAN